MVLPGLAWAQVESAAEEIDGGFEMFLVSIPTGLAFNRHDLAVQACGHGIGHPVAAVSWGGLILEL